MGPPTTVTAYLEGLPPERKQALAAVRKVIRAHLPEGFEETFDFGMVAYVVPLATLGALPVELVGEAIGKLGVDEFIALYESSRR